MSVGGRVCVCTFRKAAFFAHLSALSPPGARLILCVLRYHGQPSPDRDWEGAVSRCHRGRGRHGAVAATGGEMAIAATGGSTAVASTAIGAGASAAPTTGAGDLGLGAGGDLEAALDKLEASQAPKE